MENYFTQEMKAQMRKDARMAKRTAAAAAKAENSNEENNKDAE